MKNFFADFDDRLHEAAFVAGQRFSVADITTLVTVDFAAKAINFPIPDEQPFAEALVRRDFKPPRHDCVIRCAPQTVSGRQVPFPTQKELHHD